MMHDHNATVDDMPHGLRLGGCSALLQRWQRENKPEGNQVAQALAEA